MYLIFNQMLMMQRPILLTERLKLRPFSLKDAPEVQRLAGEFEIAHNTLNIPHPYEDGMAEAWIETHEMLFESKKEIIFAITGRETEYLVGSIGILRVNMINLNAEIGYWIGKPYWNMGYCTEAARAVVKYGFEVLGLHKIYANHFTRNPASGRVMQKIGMKHEGSLREQVKKDGRFESLEVYGILKSEFIP